MALIDRFGFLVRGFAAVAAAFLLLAGTAAHAAPPAHAAPADDARKGLYGVQDPTYDGAFRQSLAILALQAAGEPVPPAAIDWLVEQQCGDGGWTAFRDDPSQPCKEKKEDSNSTAMAVQALASVGGLSAEVGDGVDWLTAQQNPDGGVGYNPGGATDANSTALFIQALTATGADPQATTTDGRSPVDALAGLQLGCDATEADRGAFAFQAAEGGQDPVANDLATVSALFALSGQVPPVTQPGNGSPRALPCDGGKPQEGDVAPAAAEYLGRVLEENAGAVPAPQGKGIDWGTTASAAIALSAFGADAEAERAMSALTERGTDYAKGPEGDDAPAGLANLVLASVAIGDDPTKVAGNAVQRLVETGPAMPERSTAEPTSDTARTTTSEGGGGTAGWVVSAVVAAVVGVGVLVLLHRRGEHGD